MGGSGNASAGGRIAARLPAGRADVSASASAAPFVTGAGSPCSSVDFVPSTTVTSASSDASGAVCSLTTLSSAGRFASGRSVGADGEEGSSRGRFAEDIAVVDVGDADISRGLEESPKWTGFAQFPYYYCSCENLCTPGMSKENVLVQRRVGDAKRDDRDCVRVFLKLRARIGGGLRNVLCS